MNGLIKRGYLFFFTLSVLGLYLAEYAKAVPSIAMIGLTLLAIAHSRNNKPDWKTNKDVLILSIGMVLIYAIQFITSESYGYLTERIQIKLPIMLLPFAFVLGPVLHRHNLIRIGLVFIAVTFLTELFILINFALHTEEYLDLISRSQHIPGPINHIRFSIMCVMSVTLSYYWLKERPLSQNPWMKFFLSTTFLIGILFLHAYSVRSGLLALYGVMLFILFRFWKQTGNIQTKLLYLILAIGLPAAAYFFSPSIQHKTEATIQDIQSYRSNLNNENNSLGKRMLSYKVALAVFKENPVLGCGIGDLEQTNIDRFRKYYPDVETVIIPHNQFIYFLMGSGLVGLLLFTGSFFYPAFCKKNKGFLVWAQYLILFISFQTEPMLETQLGVAYAILFILFTRALHQADAVATQAA